MHDGDFNRGTLGLIPAMDAIILSDREVVVGIPGRPFLILRADGRVQFGDKTKPDSAALRFLAVLEAHWPKVLKRLEIPPFVQQSPPGEPELYPHASIDEQLTTDGMSERVGAAKPYEGESERLTAYEQERVRNAIDLSIEGGTPGAELSVMKVEEGRAGEDIVMSADEATVEAVVAALGGDLPSGSEAQEDAQHESDKDAAAGLV